MKPQSRPPFSEIVSDLETIIAGQQAEQMESVEGEFAKIFSGFLKELLFGDTFFSPRSTTNELKCVTGSRYNI